MDQTLTISGDKPFGVFLEQFGDVQGGEQVKLKWDPVDCANAQACAPLFSPFADLVKEMKTKLGEEDFAE